MAFHFLLVVFALLNIVFAGNHGGEHGSHGGEHGIVFGENHGGEHGKVFAGNHGGEHGSHGGEHGNVFAGNHGGEHGSHGGEHGNVFAGNHGGEHGSHGGEHGNVFAGNHGGEQEEAYWKSVFPNNPMPKALKDILPPSGFISGGNYKNGESIKDIINGPQRLYGYKDPSKEFKVPLSQWFYDYDDLSRSNFPNSLSGENHANGLQTIEQTVYFFEKDLRPGKLMNLEGLIAKSDKTPFLPAQVVKSIPFSSDESRKILNEFSLKPRTREADAMNFTIRGCERVAMKGEEKFCATSFESFVDLSISKLGKQIQLLSTELSKETKDPLFTLGRGIQNMGENEIVCHKMEYPAAVFLCHSIDKTTVYKVPLTNKDGTKANALAVCHRDTSAWNPKHRSFQMLKVTPGTVPICHFLVRDTLVWVSN